MSSYPMSGPEVYDIAIVGGGPTGLFACFYAGMRGMRTLLIEAMPSLGGQLTFLYPEKFIYDVAGLPKILAKDLVKNLVDQALQFKPTVLTDEKVRELKRLDDGIIELVTDKGVYFSRTALIAAGLGAFSPKKLGIESVDKWEGRGVYYVVTDKWSFKDKRVLIVGGGDTAVDWALNLKDIARSVTLIHRRGHFRAHEASVVELFHSNVEVLIPYVVKSAEGDDKLRRVTIINTETKEEEVREIDALLPMIGYALDTSIFRRWGLDMDGPYIKVNGRMETNIAGVYAAGDIVMPTDSVKLNLICVGFAQAAIAVNVAKNYIDPKSSVFPGHSSEKKF